MVGSGVAGIIHSVWGDMEMINCCNLAKIQSSNRAGGLIAWDDVNGDTEIINSYNIGELTGTNKYACVGGVIANSYSTGTRNIINTCSLGIIYSSSSASYTNNFYNAYGGATVNLSNCYYLDTIINDNVTINEDSIAFSKGDTSIIDKLNEYVEEHKYDYAVELYTWELDEDGLPTFVTN